MDSIVDAFPWASVPRAGRVPVDRYARTLKVERILAARGVANHLPIGISERFGPNTAEVFCWSDISVEGTPASIRHVWYHDEKRIVAVHLDILSPRYKSYSRCKVIPGRWRVDVARAGYADNLPEVIGSTAFIVY